MDDLFERTTNSPPSGPAAHLLTTPPPTGSTQRPTWQPTGSAAGHVSSVQTSPTTWQDNITVTVQPQLLMSNPTSPSHVLDIEVFQPQPQQQGGAGAGDNNNTGDQAGDN